MTDMGRDFLVKEVARLRAELAATEKDRDDFRRSLLAVHDALHAECGGGDSGLPEEIRALRAELAQLRASVPVLQAQVEEATRQRDEWLGKVLKDASILTKADENLVLALKAKEAALSFQEQAVRERDVARHEAEQWRREHEVMCIEAKDARARSRQDADERDAARADLARAQTRIDGLEGVATQLREVRAKLEAEREELRAKAESRELTRRWLITRFEEEARREGLEVHWTDGGGGACPGGFHRNPYFNRGVLDAALAERDAHKARAEALEMQVVELNEEVAKTRKEADAHWFNFCERSPDARRAFNAEKERDAARADVEALTARVGVLREALRHMAACFVAPSSCDECHAALAALASPDAEAAARDERLKAEAKEWVRTEIHKALRGESGYTNTTCLAEIEAHDARVRALALEEAAAFRVEVERDCPRGYAPDRWLMLGNARIDPPCGPAPEELRVLAGQLNDAVRALAANGDKP